MKGDSNIVVKAVDLGKIYHKQELDTTNKIPFHALKNISFELEKGEVLGIIGQNGSGKSTLLRILSGITKPSEGSVEIMGAAASILDIGTGIHPDLSGRENTYLRGQLLGMTTSDIKEVYDELVEFSGVGEFMDTPVKHYSSGMFLRLAFSIIVHLKSDILLLDEVLSVGDEMFRRKCAEKISQIVSNGSTVILVSHDLRSVMDLCSKVMLLRHGEIVTIDNPVSVISNTYLGKLMGVAGVKDEVDDEKSAVWSSELLMENGLQLFGIELLGSELGKTDADGFEREQSIEIKLSYQTSSAGYHLGVAVTDFISNRLIDDSPLRHLKTANIDPEKPFSSSWTIPSNFLNAGIYYIDLYLVDSNLNVAGRFAKVKQFKITDEQDETVKSGYFRSPIGVDLNFQIEQLND